IEVDADQPALLLLRNFEEDAVRGGAELGIAAFAEDAGRGSAVRGDAEDAGLPRPLVRGHALAAAQLVDDGGAVGGEAGAAVMARLLGHRAQVRAVGRDGPDFAEALVVPRHEGDPRAVARPGGEELEVAVLRGQRPWAPAGRRGDVKAGER